jgi:glycosyltransferase involved in cell wall biosynthesis
MFAGTVGLAHGLDVLVEASRLAGAEVVQTTIAGDGADWSRVRALVQQHQLDNVQMVGTLAADQIPSLYAQSDAAAVLLRDLPIFRGALPTKLLEAMAAGRPLLLGASGESAQLVEQVGCGIVVRPGDPAALADAIARLHGDPGAREAFGRAGRSYAESHFGTARAAEQWMACLQEAIAIHRGS